MGIMSGIDLSIFGGNAGVSGGSLGNVDSYARGDFRMPVVFGGVSARNQKKKPVNVKQLAKNVLNRKKGK